MSKRWRLVAGSGALSSVDYGKVSKSGVMSSAFAVVVLVGVAFAVVRRSRHAAAQRAALTSTTPGQDADDGTVSCMGQIRPMPNAV